MIDPVSLGIAGIPVAYKFIQGLIQGDDADKLKKRDTTPPAFTEALQTGRQAAAAGLPGEGQQLDRANAVTNDTLSAATRAGTSSQSIMGALGTADANRLGFLADLATRADANHQQKERELTGLLTKQASYQDRDQQQLDSARGALNEASQRNIYSGVNEGSQLLNTYLASRKKDDNSSSSTGVGADASGLSPHGPDYLGSRRKTYKYGIETYGLGWD